MKSYTFKVLSLVIAIFCAILIEQTRVLNYGHSGEAEAASAARGALGHKKAML